MIFTRFAYTILLATVTSLTLTSKAFANEEVQLQFVSFPKLSNAKPVELVIGEDETMLVELPTNSISSIYKVRKQGKWMLGKTVVDEKNKKSFNVYGQAPAISASKQLILVIRKGKNDSDGFELIPINNQISNFGGGKYFLMNATRVDIAGSIGTATGKFALKPGSHTLVAPEPSKTKNDRKYCYAKIYFRRNKETQPFFTSTWRFNERARSMVFFYRDPHTTHLRLHTIRDYVQLPSSKNKQSN